MGKKLKQFLKWLSESNVGKSSQDCITSAAETSSMRRNSMRVYHPIITTYNIKKAQNDAASLTVGSYLGKSCLAIFLSS